MPQAIRPPLMQLYRYLNIWKLRSNYTHRFSLVSWDQSQKGTFVILKQQVPEATYETRLKDIVL
jgi:hypothetical protein